MLAADFHCDVRQLSTQLLESIADARRTVNPLPAEQLHALALRIEAHLAAAKQYNLQSALVSLLFKASQFHKESHDALQALQQRYGGLEPTGTPTRPDQPSPRALLAAFNAHNPDSAVFSFLPRRLVAFAQEVRPDELSWMDWNHDDVRFAAGATAC